ncbi:MAG TPA: TonB family protein [Terriglobales bacterium]|nr:TonB family protein [Terriglobales bacterium]
MSYKALLFCPDETAARLVTQVLSELDFTVELSFEPFVTVKKLTEEPFDALVVDCANEQNASLLFKGARNSSLNHSSLCVAVAEGQAGVANAFRIGANLVLTKPVNIEQSKNTLRVAKGLLRKNAPPSRGTTAEAGHAEKPSATPTFNAAVAKPSATSEPSSLPGTGLTGPQPAARAVPTSLFEAEQVKPPAADSIPKQTPASTLNLPGIGPSPMARAAAAPALAPERPNQAEVARVSTLKTAPPLATQDPIFVDSIVAQRPEIPAPTFSSYAPRHTARKSGGGKVVWIIGCLLVLGAGGFFAWKKLPLKSYIGRIHIPAFKISKQTASAPADNTTQPAADNSAAPTEQQVTAAPASSSGSSAANADTTSSAANSSAAVGFPTKEHIDISAPAEAPQPAAEKPQPVVVVKPAPVEVKEHARSSPAPEQPAPAPQPPQLALSGSNTSESALAGIVETNPALPTAAPGTVRISQGITQGLLMKRVAPAYPPMALQMRKEGSVELLAAISKSGAISKVKVLSGDPTLAKSAVEAVRQWKYRPYLLNGEPVEIETQITINFKLPR